jgi:hypothetical protein
MSALQHAPRLAALALLLSATSGCGAHSVKPPAAAAQHVEFGDASFAAVVCAAPHALANCFAGTGTATIAPLGKVSLSRTVLSGDQQRSAPDGCDPADTTGTLTGPGGASASLSGAGTLCGAVATYTLVVKGRSGAWARLAMTGTIHNNGGAESWDVATLTNS